MREAYELAHRIKLREARWGSILLIVIGVTISLVSGKNHYPLAVTLILVGGYLMVRSKVEVRRLCENVTRMDAYEATVSEAGVTVKGATSTGQYDWAHFSGYRNTQNGTALFHCESFVVFPNSALSQEALADLRAAVSAHLKPLSDPVEKATSLQVFFVISILVLSIFFLATAVLDALNKSPNR
jgi:hypothetical protein